MRQVLCWFVWCHYDIKKKRIFRWCGIVMAAEFRREVPKRYNLSENIEENGKKGYQGRMD